MMVKRRRWLIAACAATVFALLASVWQGWIHWSSRNPGPDLTVPVTQQVQVQGVNYRIDEIRTGHELPADDSDAPMVRAPDGATIILVIMSTEIVDEQLDPDENFCEATLIDSGGRVWRIETDLTYALKRPEALSCIGTSEKPIEPHRPLQVGFSFIVPDDAVDDVDLRLQLPSADRYLINFSR